MALRENHFDEVVAAILVFLVGFGLAAVFPGQAWIRTATWTLALGLGAIAVGRRWAGGSTSRDVDWLHFPDDDEEPAPDSDDDTDHDLPTR